jgi:hypothetical protein
MNLVLLLFGGHFFLEWKYEREPFSFAKKLRYWMQSQLLKLAKIYFCNNCYQKNGCKYLLIIIYWMKVHPTK